MVNYETTRKLILGRDTCVSGEKAAFQNPIGKNVMHPGHRKSNSITQQRTSAHVKTPESKAGLLCLKCLYLTDNGLRLEITRCNLTKKKSRPAQCLSRRLVRGILPAPEVQQGWLVRF